MKTSLESVAADLRFAKGNPAQWAAEAKRLRTKAGGKGGVGTYVRSGFVHCDNSGWAAPGRASGNFERTRWSPTSNPTRHQRASSVAVDATGSMIRSNAVDALLVLLERVPQKTAPNPLPRNLGS